jgi:deoxycytidine triphosphate deaminase
MTCLSNIDIINELGKNIYIYPLNLDNIKGSTINLTASKFAWSLKNNKRKALSEDGKQIVISSGDTVLVETEEVIFVSNKICGDYHSKVRLVSKGIGHIGTTLDPLYIGPSLIALHNHTDSEIRIEVGDSIVSLMVYYMQSESTKKHNNSSGQLEILNGCEDFQEIDKFLDHDWCKNPSDLKMKMNNSDEYKKIKIAREKIQTQKVDKEKHSIKHLIKHVGVYLAVIIIFSILTGIEYKIEKKISDPNSTLPVFNFIVFVGFSGLIGSIFLRCVDWIKKEIDRRVENANIKN